MTYPPTAPAEGQLYRRLRAVEYTHDSPHSIHEFSTITAWAQATMSPASLAKSLTVATHSHVDVPHSILPPLTFSSYNVSPQAIRLATHLLSLDHPLLANELALYYSHNLYRASGWNRKLLLALLRQPAMRTHPKMTVAFNKARNLARRRASSNATGSTVYGDEFMLSLLVDPCQWVPLYTRYSSTLPPSLRLVFTSDLTHEHFTAIEPLQWPDVLLDPDLCDWALLRECDIPPLPTKALARVAAYGSPFLRSWVVKQMAKASVRPPKHGYRA